MNTIRKKIIGLSAFVWIAMLLVWMLMVYSNQKTIEKYNEILQRYMLIKESSQASQESVSALNRYLSDANAASLVRFEQWNARFAQAREKLDELRNDSNHIALIDYDRMIANQLESMKLAVYFAQSQNVSQALNHFNEALMISRYISEATLSLMNRELTTYADFYQTIMRHSDELKRLSLWMLLVTSFMVLLMAYRFSDGISRPILELTRAAREIVRGNFDRSVEVRSKDEIHFLAETFDRMRMHVRDLIEEIQNKAQMERELHEHKLMFKEQELRSLQSQINPHFLFNTLNTLSKKAYLEGAMETSELIVSVSDLLRYNLKSLDKPVTLREELAGLRDYLAIQTARFGDRVRFTREVDESLLSFELPSLTIQPLVENAFIHAIEPFEEGGHITVRVYEQAGYVFIEIEDDGPGIAPETIRSILAGERSEPNKGHSTGIGIGNVLRRLRLFYGVDEVMHIDSEPGGGTRIRLQLPKTRSGRYDGNPESAYRR